MSELLWTQDSANARMRELEKERDELKRENARLKSEVESLRKAEGTMCAEIDLCHAALEKAREVITLEKQGVMSIERQWFNELRDKRLATINELLQKGSK